MKRFIILFACVATMFSCHEVVEEPNGHGIFSKHFISGFSNATSVILREGCADFDGVGVFKICPGDGDLLSGGHYHSLCEYWGDTSYDRWVNQDPSRSTCYANMFTSVDIISSADFNDVKAGESLADIVIFRGATAKPYIENGYIPDPYGWSYDGEMMQELGHNGFYYWKNTEFYPILKRLSELTPEDLILLSANFMSIRFEQLPEIKEHTLTIIFREGNNEVRGEIDVVFP